MRYRQFLMPTITLLVMMTSTCLGFTVYARI